MILDGFRRRNLGNARKIEARELGCATNTEVALR